MYNNQTTVLNDAGLHARPATDFINQAKKFKSKITICRTDEQNNAVNAKSILHLLSLGVNKGVGVEIAATGEDEQEAVDTLIALIESFGSENRE